MNGYVIGIDGGGSKTIARLADLNGNTLAVGNAGPTNPHHISMAHLESNLKEAIDSTLNDADLDYSHVRCIFAGIAGAGTSHEIDSINTRIQSFANKKTRIVVKHDLYIALSAGIKSAPGIVAVAGTGAACYGRNASGEECRLRDNDIGSGSWIGLQAIKEATHPNADTKLKIALSEKLGLDLLDPSVDDLQRHEIAALFPVVEKLAMAGNQTAIQIVGKGINNLCSLILQARSQLKLSNPRIVLAGGLMNSIPYKTTLVAKLERALPLVKIIDSPPAPVVGAVYDALSSLGIELTESS